MQAMSMTKHEVPPPAPVLVMAAARQKFTAAVARDHYVFKQRVEDAWQLLQQWYSRAGVDQDKAGAAASLALSTMTAFAALPDTAVQTLAKPESGWARPNTSLDNAKIIDTLDGFVKNAKMDLIASVPELAAFYAERDRWGEEEARRQQQATQQRQAEFDAAAPARLFAKLKSQGISLGLEGNKLTVPAGVALHPQDHAAIVEHKAGLVLLVREEVAANRPVVVA